VAVPDDDVSFNPSAQALEMHVHDLHLDDYFNIPNGLRQGAENDATVSFDVTWSGPLTRHYSVNDTMFGFAGTFAEVHANVTWSGGNDATGFHFQADPGDFGTTVALGGTPFAEFGFERNGVFFQPDGSNGQGGNAVDAVLVQALAGSPAAPALAGSTLPLRTRPAEPTAGISVGAGGSIQQPSVASRLAGAAAPIRAIDQLFADPVGGAFSAPF
jgi:hypothetical protein